MRNRILLAIAAVSTIGLLSCQKSENKDLASLVSSDANLTSNLKAAIVSVATTQVNQVSAEDIQSVSVFDFDSARHKQGFGHMGMPGGHFRFDIPLVSSCATVTESDSVYPKTITIDYGTGCTNSHGQFKQGSIVVEITDSFNVAGSVKTITYKDFYVDSVKIELSAKLENLGKNASGNWVIASNYTQKTTGKNGDVVVENNSDTTEWVSGFGTVDKSDDIFYKTGSGKIVINDTSVYSRVITKALLTDRTCGYITSGTVELNRNGDVIVIDYGDGTCDNIATVTTNGTTEEISLSSHMFKDDGRFGKHCKQEGERGGHGAGRGEGPHNIF